MPTGQWLNIGNDSAKDWPREEVLKLAALMGITAYQDYIIFTLAEARQLAKGLMIGNSQADLLLDCKGTLIQANDRSLKMDKLVKSQAVTIESQSGWIVGLGITSLALAVILGLVLVGR